VERELEERGGVRRRRRGGGMGAEVSRGMGIAGGAGFDGRERFR